MPPAPVPAQRVRELRFLLAASVAVVAALLAVLSAKTAGFRADHERLRSGLLVNLNAAPAPSQLTAVLERLGFSGRPSLELAGRILRRTANPGALRNVGALRGELGSTLPKVKPYLVVRTPREFLRAVALYLALYLSGFYAVHAIWRRRRFAGDGTILPVLHVLTGIGLTIALSLRDPLRDTLEFRKFSIGVALGCVLLLLPLFRFFDYRRYETWIYTPLIAAFALFGLLLGFGTGPTGNDAKVNLGPVQPAEMIKILLVLFLAGYFARRWEWLRELGERRLPRPLRRLHLPRIAHAMPVFAAASASLSMFFALKDLGPALVMATLFVVLYAIARRRAGLAIAGVLLVTAGVAAGYRLGTPATVAARISMWLSPWNNDVRGGDQLVHATWAFATGGPFGSGPGRGDPAMIPAGHTDLVLPAFAEEWGFPGVLAVALLFALLCGRSIRISMQARDDYGIFLGLGLSALIALQMLLISAGVLGAIPLTGIVSPFLSSGNSAMLANFLIFAVIMSISNRPAREPGSAPFRGPVRVVAAILAMAGGGLVGKAAVVQVLQDDELLVRDVVVYQADGIKRPQHNPRLNSLAQSVPRGTIYDRNGVVLARTGPEGRSYPYARATAHLLGDARTRENFAASNSSLIEDDQNQRLRGFSSYGELAALVRYRHQPGHPGIAKLQSRNRDVRTTIDIRLQQRAVEILDRRLNAGGTRHGALVVLAARSGDVLALASAPAPAFDGGSEPGELLDRARYGQYPPGSAFKLVTAIAALREHPDAAQTLYACRHVGGGRVGARIQGWRRPVRDDAGDPAHGMPDMMRALAVSCNAYFAQLAVLGTGARPLHDTARMLELPAGELHEIQQSLPLAGIGQGPVLATPFQLARVAATVAADGEMPQGRWLLDDANTRTLTPRRIVSRTSAAFIAAAMRAVVTAGTARRAMESLDVAVAGKTGTAQTGAGEPHAWFVGFAPYDAPPQQRIAFAVVVEHAGYGARAAAPIAREIVEAARDLAIIPKR
jgi:cell division protein FtsI/penicillin-binding protein 2/cell division protein FtsW (lipid II flippase)